MLTCIYHPLDHFRVVEHDEADRLKATGVWFDCPKKAKAYKEQVEADVQKEKAQAAKQKARGQTKGDKP